MITAAASLHWMDWAIVLPRFADHLASDGYLAIIDVIRQRLPWDTESGPLFRRYSMNRDYQPYDMLSIANTLEDRGLFRLIGQEVTQPILFRQPVGDWVEAVHAANGFSRDRMKPEDAHAFDMQFAELIQRYCADGVVEAEISGRVLWGKPLAPA